jgi:hypothetical protein
MLIFVCDKSLTGAYSLIIHHRQAYLHEDLSLHKIYTLTICLHVLTESIIWLSSEVNVMKQTVKCI